MMLADHELFESSQRDDPCLDYCLWDYESNVSRQDKFRSINLLYQSFVTAGVGNEMFELCAALREGIGDWRTVWGVKNVAGDLSWEFYFYDYQRMHREVSISKVIDILGDFTNCQLQVNEDCLYFMFSIDLDDALVKGQRDLQEVNVYLGDISEHVSAGICYRLNENGLRLDNLYHFFDAETAMEHICNKIVASLHVSLTNLDISTILLPEFMPCKTIVVANKKHNDGIYFSRINIMQLIIFLKMMGYPPTLTDWVQNSQAKLDHLLYDVGIDYKMEEGRIRFLKSSFYGVF